jgi:hypothetical protein
VVLIYLLGHHEPMMFVYFVLALIVLVGPLAYVAGRDSRIDDIARRRRYHG